MVERPIKKSERQSKLTTDNNSGDSDSLPPVESNPNRSKRNDGRSSGKGKKASFADESKQKINPALARGPKPTKNKPTLKIEPETESEPVSEESQGETTSTSE